MGNDTFGGFTNIHRYTDTQIHRYTEYALQKHRNTDIQNLYIQKHRWQKKMISKAKLGSPEEHAVEGRAQHGRAHWDSCHHSQVCRPMMIIISVTRRYRSDAGYWHSVTESSLALTLLMWPWWVRIPMEMMEMVKMMKMTVTISSCGGNLLMNIGPSSDGSIEPIFQERLRQVFFLHTYVISFLQWLNIKYRELNRYFRRDWDRYFLDFKYPAYV